MITPSTSVANCKMTSKRPLNLVWAYLGVTTIIIPKNTTARVSFDADGQGDGRDHVTATGAWQQVESEYVLPGKGPQINIVVSMGGPGSLTLSIYQRFRLSIFCGFDDIIVL